MTTSTLPMKGNIPQAFRRLLNDVRALRETYTCDQWLAEWRRTDKGTVQSRQRIANNARLPVKVWLR